MKLFKANTRLLTALSCRFTNFAKPTRFYSHYTYGPQIRFQKFQQFSLLRNYSTNAPKEEIEVEKIRNIAIIAHVDVGKTTLVDCLLKQTGTVSSNDTEERVMDSMALEKERGITIRAKWTAVNYKDYRVNIVDTPGHADFGGEVERILGMVDGVCLLVDATEGVMPQTKFVLSKALGAGLKPIVIINKCDRETARVTEVIDEILNLFIALDATDEQLDFPILYASAKNGWAVTDIDDTNRTNMNAIFETVIQHIPAPKVTRDAPFSMLVTNLEHDKHFGRLLTGKIYSGKVSEKDTIKAITLKGDLVENGKVYKLLSRVGLDRTIIKTAYAGDIVCIAGLNTPGVTDTVCAPEVSEPINTTPLDPPIITVLFRTNDSPLCGQEGSNCSAIQLRERLEKEARENVTISIRQSEDAEAIEVLARGEMQIAILVEQMRREGYEFALSPPKVIYKKDEKGKILEPIEEVILDIDNEYAGTIIQDMNARMGDMLDYIQLVGKTRLRFLVPTRCLIGYRSEFTTQTRGTGVLNHVFYAYEPFKGTTDKTRKGVIISLTRGKSSAYALQSIEARGKLFIGPQVQCYEGMIIGAHAKEGDITVNPCKAKHLTNMRSTQSEDAIRLQPVQKMGVEEALSFIQQDELIEVTPKSIRIRKKILDETQRKISERKRRSGVDFDL